MSYLTVKCVAAPPRPHTVADMGPRGMGGLLRSPRRVQNSAVSSRPHDPPSSIGVATSPGRGIPPELAEYVDQACERLRDEVFERLDQYLQELTGTQSQVNHIMHTLGKIRDVLEANSEDIRELHESLLSLKEEVASLKEQRPTEPRPSSEASLEEALAAIRKDVSDIQFQLGTMQTVSRFF
ncbi:hypothetical protein GMRT_15619 [Giardia muris]|uniref:Uncharacterized protein n=1 Tax=Giardia muris TaxID=5742 RepID=A0A4Z1SSN4_GIAMU|nr:hypothetical protein GMRT_15619 [Giardia muris]|eukprot:TNJ28790.1 hypothetical protein GMRT_15619 [Giardia muris]